VISWLSVEISACRRSLTERVSPNCRLTGCPFRQKRNGGADRPATLHIHLHTIMAALKWRPAAAGGADRSCEIGADWQRHVYECLVL